MSMDRSTFGQLLYQRRNFLSIATIAALAMGTSGCGVRKNAMAVTPTPAAAAPTLQPVTKPTCPSSATHAAALNPAPLLVEYFLRTKGNTMRATRNKSILRR